MKTDFGSTYWLQQVASVAALLDDEHAATEATATPRPDPPAPRKRWHIVNGRVVPGGIGEPKPDDEPTQKSHLRNSEKTAV